MGKPEKATSKAYQIRFTEKANQHLIEITGYIAFIAQQPTNALKVGDAIIDTVNRIQRNPLAFKEIEELKTVSKMYRRAVCAPWLIVFKVHGDEITILGIIHRSRKVSSIKALRKKENP